MRFPLFALIVTGILAVCSCNAQKPRQSLTSVGTFIIEGSAPYLETGYDLVPGNYYTFRHKGGRVCTQGERRCAPPRGSDIPDEESWGLKLVVGDELVQVRDGLILTVEETTPLTFYVPDGDEVEFAEDKRVFYEDNSGHWDIEVLTFSEAPEADWLQGVSITSYSQLGYCSEEMVPLLKRLTRLGANAVQYVVVYGTDGNKIFPFGYSPRSYCLVKATEAAHKAGLKVSWGLHVDPPDNAWRGAIEPKDREALFAAYHDFAAFYGQLAQESQVEYFVPATEMVSLMKSKEDRDRWLSIFLHLHTLYFGTIMYGADRVEYADINGEFWRSCCDAIGMTPWYTLTADPHPVEAQLAEAWKTPLANIEKFADAVKLRMYLVEAPGYRAIEGCATDPSEYVSKPLASDLCQAESYKAFLSTFKKEKRQLIAGYFLWEIRAPGEEQSQYSPLDRITESILKNAWKGVD